MIVRISKGSFGPDRLHEAEKALAESEVALRRAIVAMPGLLHYYVAIDRLEGQLTNVSVWDSLDHAQAMSQLPEMLAQRPILESAGVTFERITNHDVLWSITP
jgi:quinol monooxygenase YgiN